MVEIIKETIKEFAESTTAHGLARVTSAKITWVKIFWLLVVLCTYGFTIYLIYDLSVSYFKREIAVQRKVVFEEVEFPAVSFCNLNPLRQSKLGQSTTVDLEALVQGFDEATVEQLHGGARTRERRDTNEGTRNRENRDTDRAARNHENTDKDRGKRNIGKSKNNEGRKTHVNNENEVGARNREKRDTLEGARINEKKDTHTSFGKTHWKHHIHVETSETRSRQKRERDDRCAGGHLYSDSEEAVDYCVINMDDSYAEGVEFDMAKEICAGIGGPYGRLIQIKTADKFDAVKEMNFECQTCGDSYWINLRSSGEGFLVGNQPFDINQEFIEFVSPADEATARDCGLLVKATWQFDVQPCSSALVPLCEYPLLEPGVPTSTVQPIATAVPIQVDCLSQQCANGGTCTQLEDQPMRCQCQVGYRGPYCEEVIVCNWPDIPYTEESTGNSVCLVAGGETTECGLSDQACSLIAPHAALVEILGDAKYETIMSHGVDCGPGGCSEWLCIGHMFHAGEPSDNCLALNSGSYLWSTVSCDTIGNPLCQVPLRPKPDVPTSTVQSITTTVPGQDDPCYPNPCRNPSNCVAEDTPGAYTCYCFPGYTGHHCETALVTDCPSNRQYSPGGGNSTCVHDGDSVERCGQAGERCLSVSPGATAARIWSEHKYNYLVNMDLKCETSGCDPWLCIDLRKDEDGLFFMGGVEFDESQSWVDWADDVNWSYGCGVIHTDTRKWDLVPCDEYGIPLCEYSWAPQPSEGDACLLDPCKNGATCTAEESGSYRCECLSGFTGQNCDSELRDRHVDDTYNPYVPVENLDELEWFKNTQGEESVEVTNSENLTAVLYSEPVASRREMGYQAEDLIQECLWSGKICTPLYVPFLYNTQDLQNITGFLSAKYGNCFTFNSGEFMSRVKQTKAGQSYGLSLTLFVDQSEYLSSITSSAGARILIHRQGVYPFMEDDGFNINVGMRTAVRLQQTKFTRMGLPYGNCTDGEAGDLYYWGRYTIRACLKTCYQQHVVSTCQCADSTMAVPGDTPICLTTRELACVKLVHFYIEHGERTCDCPQLCEDTDFEQSVSEAEWPGYKYMGIIKQSFANRSEAIDSVLEDEHSIRENFLKLDVYFEMLRHYVVEESEAYGMTKMLSDTGGQLGLWTGISVITLCEFCQLLLDIATFFCKKRRRGEYQEGSQEGDSYGSESEDKSEKHSPLLNRTPSVHSDAPVAV